MQYPSFFKTIPADCKHLLSAEDYLLFIRIIREYFAIKEEEIIDLQKGMLITVAENEKSSYDFNNLMRVIAQQPKENWEATIYSAYNKNDHDDTAFNYFVTDYDTAKQLLCLVVLSEQQISIGDRKLLYRVDFSGTYTFVAVDYGHKIWLVEFHEALKWNVYHEELFRQAAANVAHFNPILEQVTSATKLDVYLLHLKDYAASYVIQLESNLPNLVGRFGTIVAIPIQGTAMIVPINFHNPNAIARALADSVNTYYNTQPGNITSDFFWYYEGTFMAFKNIPTSDPTISLIEMPDALKSLLNLS